MSGERLDKPDLASAPEETEKSDPTPSQTPEEKQSHEEAKRVVAEMFDEYRSRLLRMIEIRLPQELRARLDANDILQESFIEAYRQLSAGVSAPKGFPLVWLRLIVNQQIVANYRKYCQTQKRNIAREIPISGGRTQADLTSTSIFLASALKSPSVAACQHELALKVRECLVKLSDSDREIITLRLFERLTNRETAEELNVTPNAASVMYIRAVKRFRAILEREKLDEFIIN